MNDECIKVVVHYIGHFVTDDNGKLKFDGERVEWSYDLDLWSYFGIVALVKDLVNIDMKEFWYSLGGQSVDPDRLKLLTDDRGVMHMLNIARLNGEGEMLDGEGEGNIEVEREMVEGVGEGNIEVETEMGYVDGEFHGHTEIGRKMVDGQGDAHDVKEAEVHEVEDVKVHHVEEAEVYELHDFELEDLGEDDDVDESEGEGVHEVETEKEYVDDDVSEESLIDVSIQQEPSTPVGECSRTIDNDCIDDVCGLSDNEWLSEELNSGPDSEDDDDSTKIRFPTFSMPKSLEAYKWEVGTYFAKKKEFTNAIRTYALSNERNLKFIKNDEKRVSVKCLGGKGNCKWYAYCSFRCDVNAWQLRKMFDGHSCSRDFNVKLMTSKWLSERMEKTVRENPTRKGHGH
ncbi:hypothetical protein V8G54_019524 [Vigna mungo]|uniref:Transposase MuDR plant domain-containing protein n=1 Tax=Vigna mungo TaxID=3915 RepID=A0AAQ3NCS2_VIGMU